MTTIARTEPTRMASLMDWPRLADMFDALMPWGVDREGRMSHSMRIEEFTRGDELVIRAECPGCDPDKDIDISLSEGMLTIEAVREEREESDRRSEFRYGHFVRSMSLPRGVDETMVSATYEDGILEVCVKLPKSEPEATRVPVNRVA